MTAALSWDFIFGCDVFCEGLFSAFAVISSASRADLVRSVSDDPRGAADELTFAVPLF
jgi:hypothetical protein